MERLITLTFIMHITFILGAMLIVAGSAGCLNKAQPARGAQTGISKLNEEVRDMSQINISSVFKNGEGIPSKYTCEGEDVNPPLYFEGLPTNTQSLVVIVEDPDAPMGTFTHWIAWDLPPQDIKEGESHSIGKAGRNDFGSLGYGGPCPPPGAPHRYFFKVYALDTTLELAEGSTKAELLQALEKEKSHIVGEGELMGVYSR